jgi:hypothetical protein
MHPSNSEPPRGTQDRASVVATDILSAVFQHLRDHWVSNINPGLRSEIAAILRDEFTDIARMTRDEIRESE